MIITEPNDFVADGPLDFKRHCCLVTSLWPEHKEVPELVTTVTQRIRDARDYISKQLDAVTQPK
jgi:hypothetical protein